MVRHTLETSQLCCKIFKMCLSILRNYTLKGLFILKTFFFLTQLNYNLCPGTHHKIEKFIVVLRGSVSQGKSKCQIFYLSIKNEYLKRPIKLQKAQRNQVVLSALVRMLEKAQEKKQGNTEQLPYNKGNITF